MHVARQVQGLAQARLEMSEPSNWIRFIFHNSLTRPILWHHFCFLYFLCEIPAKAFDMASKRGRLFFTSFATHEGQESLLWRYPGCWLHTWVLFVHSRMFFEPIDFIHVCSHNYLYIETTLFGQSLFLLRERSGACLLFISATDHIISFKYRCDWRWNFGLSRR